MASGITVVDIVLGLLVIGRILVGLKEGLSIGLLSLVGMVVGTVGGLWLAPQIISAIPGMPDQRLATSATIVVVIIVCIVIGHLVFTALGKATRKTDEAHGADAYLGAIASLMVVSLLSWGVLTALRPVAPPRLAEAIDRSVLYRTLDGVIPDQFNDLPLRAVDALTAFLPNIFNGTEPVLPISPPDRDPLGDPAVEVAGASVLKIITDAPRCASDAAGSGWVVAPERVVTNAHVVAGSESIMASVRGEGEYLAASLVAFDDDLDLAILAVSGLDAPPLERTGPLASGDDAIALGFPWAGSYDPAVQRVRGIVSADGLDIYGQDGVNREIYALRGAVRPGNSGGPLITSEGKVAGTVFARSAIDPQTGYALTDAATGTLLDQAAALSQPVSSGACVLG